VKWSLIELRRQSRRKWPARLAVTTGVLVALWILFGFFALPPLLKTQATKRLSVQLQRTVTIERIRTNPLTLSVQVDGLVIREQDGAELASWRSVYLNFSPWSRLTGHWQIQDMAIDGFIGHIGIDPQGRLNFADLLSLGHPPEDKATSSPMTPVAIDRLEVTDARIHLKDDSQKTPFSTEIGPLTFTLRNFYTAGDPRAPYEFTAKTKAGESVSWHGSLSVNPLRSEGELALSGLALPKYAPYYAERIAFTLQSGLASARIRYSARFGGDEPVLRVSDSNVTLTDLKIVTLQGSLPLLTVPELTVTGIEADAITRAVSVAGVAIKGGSVEVRRSPQGIDFLDALRPIAPGSTPAQAPAAATPAAIPAAAPQVRIDGVSVAGVRLNYSDTTTPRPVALVVEEVQADVRGFSLADRAVPMPFKAAASLPGGGRFSIEGNVTASPFSTEVNVGLKDFPVASLSPYLESRFDLWLAKGKGSLQGKLSLTGAATSFTGSASVDDLVAIDNAADEEVVSWSALALQSIDYSSAKNQLTIGEWAWSSPSLRIRIGSDGQLNLARLQRPAPATSPVKVAPGAPAPPAPSPALSISLDRFVLERATVGFSDRSVSPAVTSAMTGLSGTITGLSSESAAQAAVELKGRIDDAAPVSISGRVRPLATPASADLKLDLRGAELSPLAPYISKYAGYALERGALSLAVHLRLANRRVESTNVATLEQFTLGARTDSPDATKLPVALAVALLKDQRGRIVIDLPIQGSLDDPEFRVGRIVLRVLGNLLAKAATSPFALLGAAFGGGGEELATQLFAAGESGLLAAGKSKLETVTRALGDRPSLRLELIGRYDSVADLNALREAEFHRRVESGVRERRKAAGVPADDPPIVEAEQVAALAELYARTFPGVVAAQATVPSGPSAKPGPTPESERPGFLPRLLRLLSGRTTAEAPDTPQMPAIPTENPAPVAPALSVETMAEQILAQIEVDKNALPELAMTRAQRVRAHLLESGTIAPDRILLAPAAAGGTRVDLTLK